MKVREASETRVQYFQCPGCNQEHAFEEKTHPWNHNYDRPSLSPPYLMEETRENKSSKCHSFITEGFIYFQSDCTHELKGQGMELRDY